MFSNGGVLEPENRYPLFLNTQLAQITLKWNRLICSMSLSGRVFEPEKWSPLFLKTL